jgi:peptide deformylase
MKKMPLRIHTWPETILRRKCSEVEIVDDEIRCLLDKMYDLMCEREGVGLAANQAGLDISLVVIQFKDKIFKLVNARIVKKKGSQKFREGCLSFPGLELEIKRAKEVLVTALDEYGKPIELKADGILAIILQHEIDHVNGVVFIDRIPFWKWVRILPRLKEIKERTRDGVYQQTKKS